MNKGWMFLAAAGVMGLCGCQCPFKSQKAEVPAELVAYYSAEPLKVDGNANEAVWKKAPVYDLYLCDDKMRDGNNSTPHESGTVQFAYDDKNFYVFADFIDSDVVQLGEEDHEHLYKTGDLAELFIMAPKTGHYWEIYGTPNEKYTLMFFPNRGRALFPEVIKKDAKIDVRATVTGSINTWSDKDGGYKIEMAVPISEFTKYGDAFPADGWKIMIARYNYSAYLNDQEYSTTSKLSKVNFHLREEYLPLVFKK